MAVQVGKPAPAFNCTAVVDGKLKNVSLEGYTSANHWVILVRTGIAHLLLPRTYTLLGLLPKSLVIHMPNRNPGLQLTPRRVSLCSFLRRHFRQHRQRALPQSMELYF